tara:strand:- start:103 stop:294 length:192 start_codon:yes stop_codon:yes gene_type:complete
MACEMCDPHGHYQDEENYRLLAKDYDDAVALLKYIFTNCQDWHIDTIINMKQTIGKKYLPRGE